MSLLQLSLSRNLASGSRSLPFRRLYTTKPPPTPPPTVSRVERLESRLPRFLRHLTKPLRTAPVSHITAFLILHEITAVVPLVGLAAAFHYSNWLPPYISEGAWVKAGTEKFGNLLRKRGWIDDTRAGFHDRWYGRSEGGVQIVVELATAYAITKALLPLRLIISVWGTPWFARWTVLPIGNVVKGWFRRRKAAQAVKTAGTPSSGAAAGTGAISAGALPKEIQKAK